MGNQSHFVNEQKKNMENYLDFNGRSLDSSDSNSNSFSSWMKNGKNSQVVIGAGVVIVLVATYLLLKKK
jgi:hypothetical protein